LNLEIVVAIFGRGTYISSQEFSGMVREHHIIPQISCVRSSPSAEHNQARVRLCGEILTDIEREGTWMM